MSLCWLLANPLRVWVFAVVNAVSAWVIAAYPPSLAMLT